MAPSGLWTVRVEKKKHTFSATHKFYDGNLPIMTATEE